MKTLKMKFATETGKTTIISIANVKEGLQAAQATALMDVIIAKNLFATSSGNIVSKDSAEIVDTQETKLF